MNASAWYKNRRDTDRPDETTATRGGHVSPRNKLVKDETNLDARTHFMTVTVSPNFRDEHNFRLVPEIAD